MERNDLIGRMVLSKTGRDKDHLYILVKQLDAEYVFLANGNTKTVDKPKKKKLKHLILLDAFDEKIKKSILDNEKSTDLKINRFLKIKGIVKED